MKKTLLLLFLVAVTLVQSQNYCKILPYSMNGVYGLVNDQQEQIVAPTYKELEIIGNYQYAVFDDAVCYNLFTGKSTSVSLSKNTSVFLINEELYVFNAATNKLINPFTKGEIPLQLKYQNFYNRTFYDKVTNTDFKVIVGNTVDKKSVFLENTKALKPFIKGKYSFKDFQVVKYNDKQSSHEIGVMTKTGNNITCYNFNGTKSFTLTEADYESIDNYAINFKPAVAEKFAALCGFKYDNYSTSFALGAMVLGAPTGRYFDRNNKKIELGNGWSLNAYDYSYRLKSDKNLSLNDAQFLDIYIFNYNEDFRYVEFQKNEDKINAFVNHPSINPSIIMLPKEQLIEFNLLKKSN